MPTLTTLTTKVVATLVAATCLAGCTAASVAQPAPRASACPTRIDAIPDTGEIEVVLAGRQSRLLARTLAHVASADGPVVVAAYEGPGGEVTPLAAVTMTPTGPNAQYRQASLRQQQTCVTAAYDAFPGEDVAVGAAFSALRTGGDLSGGHAVHVIVLDAGEATEAGLDLAEVDFGEPAVASRLVNDLVTQVIRDVPAADAVRITFLGVDAAAENGIVKAQRRDFFAALCRALTNDLGMRSCDVSGGLT